MDIEVDIPRDQSILANFNNSRELSIYFNALSIVYADRIQALPKCLTWAEQVENLEFQSSSPALSYATVREETNNTNIALVVKTIDSHIVNICTP